MVPFHNSIVDGTREHTPLPDWQRSLTRTSQGPMWCNMKSDSEWAVKGGFKSSDRNLRMNITKNWGVQVEGVDSLNPNQNGAIELGS